MATELVVVSRGFQEINHNKIPCGFMLILRVLSQGFSLFSLFPIHQYVLSSIPRVLVLKGTGSDTIRIISHLFHPILKTKQPQNNNTNTTSTVILENIKKL